MADQIEIATEQAYFDHAWERRETTRATAQAGGTGHVNRYDVVALNAQNRSYLEQLGAPDVEVAHGAMALDDGEVLYIGRNTIWDQDKDVLVINWRTEIGERYERATVHEPVGVARKRAFKTKNNTILDFEDVVFAELAARVSELSELELNGVDDALLDDLNTGRTGAMRDIVRTIQAAQSGLIRHPANSLLVVQGGPGTGKSAVALHRASWLLFNEDGLTPDRLLIIGPTETFTNYIKGVLPALGDNNVPQVSLRQLGPIKSSRRDEPVHTARLKGEARMAGLIERALHLRIRFAGDDPALVIGTGRTATTISREDVEKRIESLRRAPTYNAGRQGMRDWLRQRASETSDQGALRRSGEVDAQAVDIALDRVWPPLTAQQFLRELLGSQARLQDAAGDAFTAGDIGRLYRQAAATMAAETWSDSDVALLDEADYRIRGSADRYQHIVVDEAQDLSPMQSRSIRRRSSNGRYTVVGDIAQSTGPWARDTWDEVIAGLAQSAPVVFKELDYGYRVPAEIYELAARLLPAIAPGLNPLTVVRAAPEPPRFILDNGDLDLTDEVIEAIQDHAAKGRFLGVVVSPEHHELIAIGLKERGIHFAEADDGSLSAAVNLISATEAKGLEFDAVVVVEPAAIADLGERGLRLLYIALTRATKYLTVVHARAFEPLGLEGAVADETPDASYLDELFAKASEEAFSADRREPSEPSASEPIAPFAQGSPAALSAGLKAAAGAIAEQIKGDVIPDKYTAILAEVARQLGIEDPPSG